MFTIPLIIQLPVGLGVGVASVLAPWLLRPFIVVGATLLLGQAALLWAVAGQAGLTLGLTALSGIVRELALILVGIGVGRWGLEVVLGRR